MEIDRSYVNTLANDRSETLSLTETELRLVDNTKNSLSLRIIITKKWWFN